MKTRTTSILLAGLLALPTFATSASAETFFAEINYAGNIDVVDSTGAAVSVVYGTPVGTKPSYCPADSYYVKALETDKAEIVLTDCATGEQNHSVTVSG